MRKILVGPRLRQLRRERAQTQAEMAATLGISPAYVNLLENNQRSLSVSMLVALSDAYGVDWRDLLQDDSGAVLADLRQALRDPLFRGKGPDLQELRGALDHAPGLADAFLALHGAYRGLLEQVMRQTAGGALPDLIEASPEAQIHDFFRRNRNHFPTLEAAAEAIRAEEALAPDDSYGQLKARLSRRLGLAVRVETVERMADALRVHDPAAGTLTLSEALDHQNRVFQLAHVLGLVEAAEALDAVAARARLTEPRAQARLRAELGNYFAAALLMPYGPFLAEAEASAYDIDRLAARFGTSFEQVAHRLTTLQREGAQGVPFFFLRVDRAGNVTKRFNATSFTLAEHGGACPRWTVHSAFRAPDVILPQFVELPDGERFFTLSRTANRPVFRRDTQDRRVALALGCEVRHAPRVGYAKSFNLADPELSTPIGINCHLCPRKACAERAHQPLVMELPLEVGRRGTTRYES
jgi:predicted transcriptional regulator/DNA-binding XRE family transcriptional regulator